MSPTDSWRALGAITLSVNQIHKGKAVPHEKKDPPPPPASQLKQNVYITTGTGKLYRARSGPYCIGVLTVGRGGGSGTKYCTITSANENQRLKGEVQ